MFKQKCERIDINHLTMKNLQRVYLRYVEAYEQELERLAKEKQILLAQKGMFKKIGAFFSSKNK